MTIEKKLEKLYALALEKQTSSFSHFAILQLKEMASIKAKINNTNVDDELETMIDNFIASLENV